MDSGVRQRAGKGKSPMRSPQRPEAGEGVGNAPGKEEEVKYPPLLLEQNKSDRWKNWWVRTSFTIVMIGGFVCIIYGGHFYLTCLVLLLQMLCFKEIISIGHVISKEKKLPWFRFLNWYFLVAANYFFYGESLIYYFQTALYLDPASSHSISFTERIMVYYIQHLSKHHRFISFSLYTCGLVLFVLSLKKGHYKFQFGQFAWTHMALLLIVAQSHFVINNIFEGLVWFLLPVSFVISNDIFAYIFGFFFGRTRLIKLSPKKTWEGFIGGAFVTIVLAWFLSDFLSEHEFFYCSVQELSWNPQPLHCKKEWAFVRETFELPALMTDVFSLFGISKHTVSFKPIQYHALFLATFASLIAPFGGFFASGFKRAFKIKDFSDSIPGHGGLTDRFDCQYLMSTFAYVYHNSFVKENYLSPARLLGAIFLLSAEDKLALYKNFQEHLREGNLI